jgi:hypothetical protein
MTEKEITVDYHGGADHRMRGCPLKESEGID